jgi:glycosyltransferase involved in cell wall biosynthesis
MRFEELGPRNIERVDLHGKRVLIFIVAYNAETTIEKVLSGIPNSLRIENVEVLIIDDSSKDETFRNGVRYQEQTSGFKITILRTPKNQATAETKSSVIATRSIIISISSRFFTAMDNTRRRNFRFCSNRSCATRPTRFSAHA